MPDETHGYLPGWIISETILEPGARTTDWKSKAGGQDKGDYDHKEDQAGHSRTLEDAALVGETLAEVILADGGEVRMSTTQYDKKLTSLCRPGVWRPTSSPR